MMPYLIANFLDFISTPKCLVCLHLQVFSLLFQMIHPFL